MFASANQLTAGSLNSNTAHASPVPPVAPPPLRSPWTQAQVPQPQERPVAVVMAQAVRPRALARVQAQAQLQA